MATFEIFGYSAKALAFNTSTGAFGLDPDLDHQTDRIKVTFTEDDDELDGGNGVGSGNGTSAIVTLPDGTFVASGQIQNEGFAEVQVPDAGTVWLERVEIGDVHLGYIASAALPAGGSFPVLASHNIDTADAVIEGQGCSAPCFGPGTMITTREGDIPVEWLSTEDEVLTRDNGFKPILWIGRTRIQPSHFILSPMDCPVEILAGALGDGQPTHDLYMTPEHRILLRSQKAELHFGSSEVIVPAKAWVNNQTINSVRPEQEFSVTRILCQDHEIILAEGSWVESFFASPETLRTLAIQDRLKIASLTNGPVTAMKTARPTLTQTEAQLILPSVERRSARRAALGS